jgi:hypothetical protein
VDVDGLRLRFERGGRAEEWWCYHKYCINLISIYNQTCSSCKNCFRLISLFISVFIFSFSFLHNFLYFYCYNLRFFCSLLFYIFAFTEWSPRVYNFFLLKWGDFWSFVDECIEILWR